MKGLLFSALILFLATCPLAYAQDAVEYFNQGNMAYREGKYDEAVESFKKALELNPTDASSHFGLGNSYFLKRNYEKAIAHYKEVIKLRPDYAKVHYALGLAYKRVGKNAEAEKAFDTYNRLSATKPEEEIKERPVVKKEEKAPERKVPEIKVLRPTEKVPPERPVEKEMARPEEKAPPERPIERPVEKRPAEELDAGAYLSLGKRHYDARRYDEALKAFSMAIRLNPDLPEAYKAISDAYTQLGREAEAETALKLYEMKSARPGEKAATGVETRPPKEPQVERVERPREEVAPKVEAPKEIPVTRLERPPVTRMEEVRPRVEAPPREAPRVRLPERPPVVRKEEVRRIPRVAEAKPEKEGNFLTRLWYWSPLGKVLMCLIVYAFAAQAWTGVIILIGLIGLWKRH